MPQILPRLGLVAVAEPGRGIHGRPFQERPENRAAPRLVTRPAHEPVFAPHVALEFRIDGRRLPEDGEVDVHHPAGISIGMRARSMARRQDVPLHGLHHRGAEALALQEAACPARTALLVAPRPGPIDGVVEPEPRARWPPDPPWEAARQPCAPPPSGPGRRAGGACRGRRGARTTSGAAGAVPLLPTRARAGTATGPVLPSGSAGRPGGSPWRWQAAGKGAFRPSGPAAGIPSAPSARACGSPPRPIRRTAGRRSRRPPLPRRGAPAGSA